MTRRAPSITGRGYVAPTALPFGPGTVSWEVAPMGLLGSSRALLLQTSHPLVAAGVAQHSDYATDPWSRLYRTFDTVLKLAFGAPEVSRRQTARMEKRHAPVTGTASDGRPYDARDHDLGLWVWATLVDTALLAHERVHGRLQDHDRRRFYDEQKLFGQGCSIPREKLPATWADFGAYVDRVVAEELEATPEGLDVAHFTFHPPAPPVLAPVLGRLNRWTAAALFPPRVRQMYDLAWTPRQERAYERTLRAIGVLDRLAPDAVRSLPIRLVVDHDLLARLDRRAAARRAADRRTADPAPRPPAPRRALARARRVAAGAGTQLREQVRGRDQPYADPPTGSGLRPILGDPGPPLVGYSFVYFGDPLAFARERHERYGPVSWARAFGIPLVSVLGPEAAGEVLTNRDKAFANGPGWEYFIGPFFRRGLMLLDFEEHLHHRRIMQQAFTRDRLVGYLKGMNAVLGDGYDAWEPGRGFRFHSAFKQLTLDLATTVFVGHHLGPEADALNQAFFDTVQAGTAFVRAPVPGGRWRRGLQGREVLESFFRAELPAKRDGHADDLFTALCHARDEDGATFTDDDVVNHMIFLLMAAHDTSTTTMTTLVYELARHRDWQDRLREESRALGTDHIEYDDLARLPHHQMAIKEAQRILAPVPSLARYAVTDTELQGHFVPKGTRLGLYPHFTMRMPEYWTDPTTFDPARFSPERREDRSHPYAWMPFGGGVHKCIGMHFGTLEVTAALHQLLLRFQWSVPDGYEMPVNLVSLPYPEDGLPIDLRPVR